MDLALLFSQERKVSCQFRRLLNAGDYSGAPSSGPNTGFVENRHHSIMKTAIALRALPLLCTLGILAAAESSVSVGALPPTICALSETHEDGKPGTTYFYNLPRSPWTSTALFSTKESAAVFIAKLTETQVRRLTPFAVDKSFIGYILSRKGGSVLLDPASPTEGGTPVVAKTSAGEASKEDPGLRDELLERGKRDQDIRFEVIRLGNEHAPVDLRERMAAIDKENRERLKEIIHQFGWPGPELVGAQAAQMAWLLVQHSDLEFQKQCLPLVKDAYLVGKLPGGDFALLQDRVLVGEGKPQIYGSQAMPVDQWKDGQPAFQPIEDDKNVDKRRAEVGLQPLADYSKSLKAMYLPHSNAGSAGTGDHGGSGAQDGKAGAPAAPTRDSK
jgi:hypothetical protein